MVFVFVHGGCFIVTIGQSDASHVRTRESAAN